ncbi:arylesterase [Minwuia thermotolerans]|uniref:Arylesterase n=1 Tax=Minwuia thermotolerans TaxID=2056226 RepID=A0A2M9FZZ3_9PROT|nr:arylesterase [Minwuia thermotolerans]PJK29009.1 arylesterase [Minwuia thermotolerans]
MLLLLVTLTIAQPISAAEERRVVMLGDSITAGYGLPQGDALPVRLEKELTDRGLDVAVENAGVSGDTTAGGLSRLDWAVQGAPDLVIVALGGNDGLRGIDPADTRRNMDRIVGRLTERGIPVLVAGMLAPPNMGGDYARAFNAIFPEVAEAHGAAFYPFLLEGVAADPALNQPDGIHPNAEGARLVAERMAEPVARALKGS